MHRLSRVRLVVALLIGIASAAPARAAVDLTGTFSVTAQTVFGTYEMAFDFVQTGTQLDLTYSINGGAPAGPYTGTIDPDTGAFTVPFPNGGPPAFCTGNQMAGVGSADSQSISGHWTAMASGVHPGCFDAGGPFTGARNVCGDGIVAGGETCDDASCCSADCSTLTADTTPCDDGDACTNGETCSAGSCGNGTFLTCQPCETCSPDGCVVEDDGGCQPALGGGKTSILLQHKSGTTEKDKLTWKWKNGAAMSAADFDDPVVALTPYHLCVIDHSNGVPTLRMRRQLSCGSGQCWRTKGSGFAYTSKTGALEGITSATLAAGAVGKGKVNVQGKGDALDLAALPLVGPVTVRLQRGDAPICWDATYSNPKKNDATTFKAKSD